KTAKKLGPDGSRIEIEMTPLARLKEYQQLEEGIESLRTSVPAALGWGAYYDQVRPLKEKANAIRTELQNDIKDRTTALVKTLKETLTTEQRQLSPFSEELRRPWKQWGRLEWLDFTIQWGLVAIGAGLILGLFTRLSCFAGAVMLLMFYLAMPPWPGLPENPKAEGRYLFINKNLIEMLALLVLSTTRSGRWLGLDGLLRSFRRRKK